MAKCISSLFLCLLVGGCLLTAPTAARAEHRRLASRRGREEERQGIELDQMSPHSLMQTEVSRAERTLQPSSMWPEVSLWIRANDGFIDESMIAAHVHGPTNMRGVLNLNRPEPRTLMVIPKRLWLDLDNFLEFKQANLSSFSPCLSLSSTSTRLLKLASAVGMEMIKGPSSWYHEYLQLLPSIYEYRTFHPQFLQREVADGFSALPLVRLAKHLQGKNADMHDCFVAWKSGNAHRGPLALPPEFFKLEWPTVELALMHTRTRQIDVGNSDGHFAIVPGLDLFNAADVKATNVDWSVSEGDKIDVHSSLPVDAEQELFAQYCPKCDNGRLMLLWGIFLQQNSNPLEPVAERTFCTDSPVLAQNGGPGAAKLRNMVAATLHVGSKPWHPEADTRKEAVTCPSLSAPVSEILRRQAPLRCNLAMLALEYCKDIWSLEINPRSTARDLEWLTIGEDAKSNMSKALSQFVLVDAVEGVHGSAIGQVHPLLLSGR